MDGFQGPGSGIVGISQQVPPTTPSTRTEVQLRWYHKVQTKQVCAHMANMANMATQHKTLQWYLLQSTFFRTDQRHHLHYEG